MLMGDNSGILTFFDVDTDISIQLELSKYHRCDSDVTPKYSLVLCYYDHKAVRIFW